MVGNSKIHILVDLGSTHNVVDINFAKKLGCTLEKINPQAITVANGNHIACQHKCTHFEWQMNKRLFQTEVLLIPLGGCYMVLGIQMA